MAQVFQFPTIAPPEPLIDDDEDYVEPPPLPPEEVLAVRYAEVDTWCFQLPLSARWAYQRGLLLDYSRTDKEGVAHRLLDIVQLGERVLEEWPQIAIEVFCMLFADAKDIGAVDSRPAPELAAALWSYLESSEEWHELKAACNGRRALAIGATTSVLRGLYYEVLRLQDLAPTPDAVKAPPPPPPFFAGGEGDGEGEGTGEGDEDDAVEEERSPEEVLAEAAAKAALAASMQHRAGIQRKLQRQTNQDVLMFQWLASLLANVQSLAEADAVLRGALEAFSKASGGYTPGGATDPLVEDTIDLELMAKLRKLPALREMLELVGRMQRSASAEPSPEAVRIQPDGIAPGAVLQDLLQSEHILEEVAGDLWLQRFLDGETMHTTRKGESPLGAGDLLILIDHSISMGGQPWTWANALGGALMLEALTAGRRCVVARYSDIERYADQDVLSLADIKPALTILSKAPDGGTDTAEALQRLSKKLAPPLREPDIVLITDGGWPKLDDITVRKLKGPDGRGRLFVILLEPSGSDIDIPAATQVWCIPSLTLETTDAVLRAVRV